ncbi:hypothetical protein V2J09_022228 [Rumex salicifolius]
MQLPLGFWSEDPSLDSCGPNTVDAFWLLFGHGRSPEFALSHFHGLCPSPLLKFSFRSTQRAPSMAANNSHSSNFCRSTRISGLMLARRYPRS